MDGLTRSSPGIGTSRAQAPTAVYCQVCGTPLRASAGLLPNTQVAKATPVRWEYVDVRLPLELYPLEEGFLDAFDAAMTAALDAFGREGWEPVPGQPTEWREIVATNRFVAGMRPGPLPGLRFLGERPMVREVLLRFRRDASGRG
jgi:hypothetical protein